MGDVFDLIGTDASAHHEPDDRKLGEMILRISQLSERDPAFEATKLNKLLFFADFLAYLHLGKSITDQEYQALPKGPAPGRLVPVRNEMESKRELAIQKSDFYGYHQERTIALREPELSIFTVEELAIIDRVVSEIVGITALDMSEASHGFIGWQLAGNGETIPYEAALLSRRELTPEEVAHGQSLEPLAKEMLAQHTQ